MKPSKIILTLIVIFSIVGSVSAYKATRCVITVYKSNAQGLCLLTTNLFYTTQPQVVGQPGFITNTIYTAPLNGPCPTTTWYTCE